MKFLKRKTRAEPRQTAVIVQTPGGDIILPEGYIEVSKTAPVRRCAHKIADMVSNMTIMLMQNGENGDIRVKNGLSYKLDVMPSKHINRKNFLYKIVMDMIINGNSFVLPIFGENDFIEDLVLIDYGRVSMVSDGADGYKIIIGGAEFSPDEVLHFSLNPSERQPWRGTGYTKMVRDAVETLTQADITKKSFLRSKWKPSIIMSIDADAEELTDPKKRKNILGSYVSDTEQGEPWIIPAGEIDIKTIQPLTLNDLAIQDSITLDLRTIAASMSVPAFMVGIGNFNKDEYNNFISTVVMSIAQVLQQELTRKLLYAKDLYFKLNPKSLMQYALSEKVSFVKEMVGGGMLTRNEGRCEFDYSPVDNEGMNDYIVLENYIPVNKVGEQKKLTGGESNEG